MRWNLRVLLVVLSLCGGAHADPTQIDAEGQGATREAAVAQALASAIKQATGVTIDVAQFSGMTAEVTATDTTHTAQMSQSAQDAIRQVAGGIVRSYRVVSVAPAPEGGFLADLSVDVEVFHAKGLGNENRRRIAVASFVEAGTRGTGARLRDSLITYLTQARRFAVVDRSNDAAYEQEIGIATSQDAAPTERVRAGQVIAADYVVTGKVRSVAASTTEQVLSLTGERIQHTHPGSASAEFEVIEIATRQIKWADKIALSGGATDADTIAARIGEEITQAIYPTRLIKFDDPQRLILNEGGMTVKPGERFRAMLLGEALEDPYTHESLGQTEQEIGIVEVTEVQSKLSYARLVSGRLPEAHQEIVLRPAAPAKAPPPRRVRAVPASTEPVGGTRLPFDR
ncbi:MAG TPA: CsgG/HfaB family protein [Rhodopila sp.]|jgi:TolB-like protein|nr:CsgG/HfaB family protein [Rhodopila sp.]